MSIKYQTNIPIVKSTLVTKIPIGLWLNGLVPDQPKQRLVLVIENLKKTYFLWYWSGLVLVFFGTNGQSDVDDAAG